MAYKSYLTNWIVPRWGGYMLSRMENGIAVHVEEWLSTIIRSRGTKAKIRNIMSAVCSHAVRYGWIRPIRSVRFAKARSESALWCHWWQRNCKSSLLSSAHENALLFFSMFRLACEEGKS